MRPDGSLIRLPPSGATPPGKYPRGVFISGKQTPLLALQNEKVVPPVIVVIDEDYTAADQPPDAQGCMGE